MSSLSADPPSSHLPAGPVANPRRMYLAATVIFLLLLSVVQAAPTKPPSASKSKPPLRPLLPKLNPLVEKLVEFDPTCTADKNKRTGLEQAVSDFYDVVEVAQGITENDPAYVDPKFPDSLRIFF